jgi:hypothetical protein
LEGNGIGNAEMLYRVRKRFSMDEREKGGLR